MDLGQILTQVWTLLVWFANLVIATVADSIVGGWNAVIILAVVAAVLFVVTRAARRSDE